MEIEDGKIYSFKMNSGEEFVAKVLSLHNEAVIPCYEIETPLSIGQTQNGPGFVPASMTAEAEGIANVSLGSIAMMLPTREDVLDAYRESTVGIKVPDKKIILG